MQALPQENRGLAEYQGTAGLPEDESEHAPDGFQRWRSSSSPYDSVPLPAIKQASWFPVFQAYDRLQPGSQVTKSAADRFEIAIWDEVQVSPLQILSHCVELADREGYKVFKLANWTVEEYTDVYSNSLDHIYRKGWIWFRSTVDVVLRQHKDPNSLEPVFDVDELRSRLIAAGVPTPSRWWFKGPDAPLKSSQ